MTPINDPIALAEVEAAFHAYEAALVANDVPTLQGFFWKSNNAIRFGAGEQLYGYDAIATFRQNRVLNFHKRQAKKLSAFLLSATTASVMFEYEAEIDGTPRCGRQSQTWLKLEEGWKIAAAHVSLLPDDDATGPSSPVATALQLHGIELPQEWLPRIESNFASTHRLAEDLLDFPLPETLEPAPVFFP